MAEISLEEFERRLNKAIKASGDLHQELLQKAGELVLDKAAEETPEVEGRLKASYERRPFNGEREWEINIARDKVETGTNVYYARMVEEGHAKPGSKGFVSGKHYFQKGYEKAEKELDKLAEEFFEKLGEVAGLGNK